MLSCGSTIPDGHDGLVCNDLLVMTIVDGARPGNRRMIAGLQPTAAEMSGSRHIRSTFHPASRWRAILFDCGWPDHKSSARIDADWLNIDVCDALAGWDENSAFEIDVTYHPTNPPRMGGLPRPPVRSIRLFHLLMHILRLPGRCIAMFGVNV